MGPLLLSLSTMISLTVIRACNVHMKITAKKTARRTKLNTAPVRRPKRLVTIQVIPKLKIKNAVLNTA